MKAIDINGNIKVYNQLPSSWQGVMGNFSKLSDEEIKAYAGSEVILSGGSINTPQLLMVSGVGPKEELKNNIKNEASYLVGNSFKLLPKPSIIVSYADTNQNHSGYIYQATNFIYTGLSDKRTEWRMKNTNKHSKTICEQYTLEERKNNPDKFEVIDRPRKHRYIYFIGSKKDKKQILKQLKYPVMEYPKFQNTNYKTNTNIQTQGLLI